MALIRKKDGGLSLASLSQKERDAAIAVLVHGEIGAAKAVSKYKELVEAGETDIGIHRAYRYWLDVLGAYKQLRSQLESSSPKMRAIQEELSSGP